MNFGVESENNILENVNVELGVRILKLANIFYSKKLNQSVYLDWSKGTAPVITKYPGLKYLQLQTNNSKIKINIK